MPTPLQLLLHILPRPDVRQRVLRTRPANLIQYLMLNEVAGSTALDSSGTGRDGTITAASLGQPGIGDGRTGLGFDGSTSKVNLYSAALASAWNGQEFTVSLWMRGNGTWGNDFKTALRIAADASNSLKIYRFGTSTVGLDYTAGGTNKSLSKSGMPLGSYFNLIVTGSKTADRLVLYINGVYMSEASALGTWAGAPASTTTVLGASTTAPLNVWIGGCAHLALWNVALSAGEVGAAGVL